MRLPLFSYLVFLFAGLTTAAAQSTLVLTPPAGVAAKGKHVVFLTGDEEYRSEEGAADAGQDPQPAARLQMHRPLRARPRRHDQPGQPESLAGAEALDTADAIVMLPPLPQLARRADEALRGRLPARRPDHRAADLDPRLQFRSSTWRTTMDYNDLRQARSLGEAVGQPLGQPQGRSDARRRSSRRPRTTRSFAASPTSSATPTSTKPTRPPTRRSSFAARCSKA